MHFLHEIHRHAHIIDRIASVILAFLQDELIAQGLLVASQGLVDAVAEKRGSEEVVLESATRYGNYGIKDWAGTECRSRDSRDSH